MPLADGGGTQEGFNGLCLGDPCVISLAEACPELWRMCLQEDVLALIDSGGSPGGSEGLHWVLDPIDGTRGFVGMRQYAVCLGLLHNGKVRVSLLHAPSHAEGCTCLCRCMLPLRAAKHTASTSSCKGWIVIHCFRQGS